MRAIARTLVCLAVFAWNACPPAAAQSRAARPPDLTDYHRLIASYRAGKTSPVLELMEWAPRQVLAVVDGIERSGDPLRPWEPARFAAAAWMHTDAALRCIAGGDRDGVSVQLDAATRVLHSGGDRTTAVARRWYFAVVRHLRDRQWLATAEKLLELGRERMPEDPVVLRESGMLAEFLATDPTIPPARAGLDGIPATRAEVPAGGPFAAMAQRRGRYLQGAERWLRRSLDLEPSSVECRLHLGRVASLLERAEGSQLLDGLRASERSHAYLAEVFLGASAERAGDLALAESRYRAAIARLPEGHAACIALCRVLRVAGRSDEARALLAASVARPAGTRREPWWWYFYEAPGLAAARMEARREEARR